MLESADMTVIRQVYAAQVQFGGTPFLPARKWWKRAKALAERGLLKAGNLNIVPREEGCDGYTVTESGIDAYNAQIRAASTSRSTK